MAAERLTKSARFGLFEVDLVSGELRKDGTRIRRSNRFAFWQCCSIVRARW